MKKRQVVKNLDEWKALPFLPVTKVDSRSQRGEVYNVIRVGFYPLKTEMGMTPYPTITIYLEEKEKLYRLPQGLSGWAVDAVALAQNGMNQFPSKVEFSDFMGQLGATFLLAEA